MGMQSVECVLVTHLMVQGYGGFSEVTDGRVLSFHHLSVGEALAPRRSRGEQRRGQVSLADKW